MSPEFFIFIAIGVGFVSTIIAYRLGHSRGCTIHTTPSKQRRRGIKKYKDVSWTTGHYGSTYQQGGKCKKGFFIVCELDRIAHKSKVELLHSQGSPLSVWKKVQYYNTEDIEWDVPVKPEPIDEMKDKLSEQERILKTPLDELVKYVENDKIAEV